MYNLTILSSKVYFYDLPKIGPLVNFMLRLPGAGIMGGALRVLGREVKVERDFYIF